MTPQIFALSFGLFGMILAAEHANAQTAPCGDHAAIAESLAANFGETLQSIGLAANNAIVEVYASAAGSWTITVSTAAGQTCLVAAGQAFQHMGSALPNSDPKT